MNIEQLQYICAVSRHKSITKAAQSLFVTQQTVSKAIGKLEKELGFQLLVRSYNGIELTEAGIIFVEKAEVILEQMHELYQIDTAASQTPKPLAGTVTIYCTDYFMFRVAPKLLLYFSEHHPNVKLRFSKHTLKDTVQLVKRENHLGFITTFDNKVGSDKTLTTLNRLAKYEMPDDDIMILMSENHPLSRNVSIDLKSLENYPIILGELPEVETVLETSYNTHLSVLMYVSDLTPGLDIIRHNTALSFITKSVLATYTLPRDVVALPLSEKIKAGNFFIAPKQHSLSELEKEIFKQTSRILSSF